MRPRSRTVASCPEDALSSVCSPCVETRAAKSTSESAALARTSSTVTSERKVISSASDTFETLPAAAGIRPPVRSRVMERHMRAGRGIDEAPCVVPSSHGLPRAPRDRRAHHRRHGDRSRHPRPVGSRRGRRCIAGGGCPSRGRGRRRDPAPALEPRLLGLRGYAARGRGARRAGGRPRAPRAGRDRAPRPRERAQRSEHAHHAAHRRRRNRPRPHRRRGEARRGARGRAVGAREHRSRRVSAAGTSSEAGTQPGIDPRGPRFGAAITAVLLLVVVGLALSGAAVAATAVLAALVAIFAWGAFAGIRRHPWGRLYATLVAPRLAPPTHREDPAAPTFAQLV